MGKLHHVVMASLDGYVADEAGNFDWAAPDEEVHAAVNDLLRPIGTYLLGRRMYETMLYWESPPAGEPPVVTDFARIWQTADKIVYSTTLETVSSARTRIERTVDPATIRQMKADAAQDMTVSGPTLAAHVLRAGLVDTCHLYVVPTVVGGGLPAFPPPARLKLDLVEERRFACGVVYLQYNLRA